MNKLAQKLRGPSIDSFDIDRIKHFANTNVINSLLVKYFKDKGFTESFDNQLYPAVLQDLSITIPSLYNKIEVVPSASDVDLSTDRAVLSWNLFALGNHRMYLGDTYHNGLHDLARQIRGGMVTIPEGNHGSARRQTTPRRVVSFIGRVLGDHDDGYVDLSVDSLKNVNVNDPFYGKQNILGLPQQFYTRSGYGA